MEELLEIILGEPIIGSVTKLKKDMDPRWKMPFKYEPG